VAAGKRVGDSGSTTNDGVLNTSFTRMSATDARWPNATVMARFRSGQMSIVMYALNFTRSPTVIAPSITRCPPIPRTATKPRAGRTSRAGRNRLRIRAASSDTRWMSSASVLTLANCTPSAPKPLITRTPETLSSTTVASCACSCCTAKHRRVNAAREPTGQQVDERQGRQREQREIRLRHEQQHDDGDDHGQVGQRDGDHHHEGLQLLQVRRGSTHQLTGLGAIVVTHVQAQQVVEDLLAQSGLDPATLPKRPPTDETR